MTNEKIMELVHNLPNSIGGDGRQFVAKLKKVLEEIVKEMEENKNDNRPKG